MLGFPIPRTNKPIGPVPLDKTNKFGAAARIFCYPVGPSLIYDAYNGKTYRIGGGGSGSIWGTSVRASTNGTIRTAACPSDLLMSKPVTQVMLIHGRAASWACNKGMRLFDTSSGSGLQLHAVYQSSTQINVQSLTFGDTGAPNTLWTTDPLAPHSIGQTYTAGAARLFLDGILIGTDSVTADADAAGTDTRVDGFSSTGTNVDYGGAFWLAGVLSDEDMARFMRNPWQALMPEWIWMKTTSAASFKAAWAGAANSILAPGARIA